MFSSANAWRPAVAFAAVLALVTVSGAHPTTNAVREMVLARAGDAAPDNPRFFMVPLCYQSRSNDPRKAHTFAAYFRVNGEGARMRTISWLPADYAKTLRTSVSGGPVPGRNFSLDETLELASAAGVRVTVWGPYEVTPRLYHIALARAAELESGRYRFVANDKGYRERGVAINCMHAVSDLSGEHESYGGVFGTGLGMWGIPGTRHVLDFYRHHGTRWMMEPVEPGHYCDARRWTAETPQYLADSEPADPELADPAPVIFRRAPGGALGYPVR